jgi:hypothetical protein
MSTAKYGAIGSPEGGGVMVVSYKLMAVLKNAILYIYRKQRLPDQIP